MKISLNSEDLRMIVLKQIVRNATIAMKIERQIWFIEWFIPFTPRKMKLRSLQKRGDKLQMFETSLSKNKNETVDIDFKDVNFIYEGLN